VELLSGALFIAWFHMHVVCVHIGAPYKGVIALVVKKKRASTPMRRQLREESPRRRRDGQRRTFVLRHVDDLFEGVFLPVHSHNAKICT